MAFPYKHVLLIGATAGIGRGLADRLIQAGVKVTAVGRRQERLDEFVSQHGEGKAKAISFDITNMEQTPKFVAEHVGFAVANHIIRTSPDIDCVFLNAGVQGHYDFSRPAKVDLAKFISEIGVNFTSFVALTHAILPYLISKKSKTGIIYTGTHLGIVPAAPLPAYSASKAALNSFVLCLRDQLRNTNVNVIELSPPLVQTELHDYMGEEAGRKIGMPLDEFTEEAFKELSSGSDQIIIGNLGPGAGIIPREELNALIDKRRSAFTSLAKLMRGES